MQEEITIEDCIAMGEDVEDKVFEKVVADVNAKHPTDSLLSYFDSLCIDLSQAESIMEDSLPRAYGEIEGVFRKQYRALNELEKHCLFTSLMTSEAHFDSLCIDLSQAESIMEDSLPRANGEIAGVFCKQYKDLNELEKHSVFTSLMTSEVDEDEIVDSLLWRFEEWMEDRAHAILGTGSSEAGSPS